MGDAGHVEPRAVLSHDTTAQAERLQVFAWRRMSSVEKAAVVTGATAAVQQLALAGIRRRHPGASERECFVRLVALQLGPALACQVYPDAAAILCADS